MFKVKKKPAPVSVAGGKRGLAVLRKDLRKNKILWLMILPAILYVIIFNYAPMTGIIVAYKKFNYTDGILNSPWVGLANFKFLLQGGVLWRITRNTVLYNIVFMIVDMVAQIAVAVMLNEVRKKWFKKTTQSLMFLPYFANFFCIGTVYMLCNF